MIRNSIQKNCYQMDNKVKSFESATLLAAFLEHRKVLAAYIAQRLLRVEDVEDILQETITSALNQEKAKLIRSPKDYLFIIARNLVSRHLKANSKKIQYEINDMDLSTIPAEEVSLEQQIDGQLQLKTFEMSVSQLPTQCRRVFLLRKVYGWSHKKIASKLGISTSTVERHITIALSRLSLSMQKEEHPVPASDTPDYISSIGKESVK